MLHMVCLNLSMPHKLTTCFCLWSHPFSQVRRVLTALSLVKPSELDEVCSFMDNKPIAIKQLLLAAEMARQEDADGGDGTEFPGATALGFLSSLAAMDYVPDRSRAASLS